MTRNLPALSKTPHAIRAFLLGVFAFSAVACAVSQQQEVALGADYAAQIEKELPLVRDAEVVNYINLLGDSLARVTDNRSLDWHFNVVNSREINAFAVPGGYVYINRGLIERAQNMAQVAGVLGHEIGHITKRHSIDQMQKAQGANMGVTLACVLTNVCNSQAAQAGINIAGGAVFAKFSRDDEREADEEGVKTLVLARMDPQGMPEMFRLLLNERKSRPDDVSLFFATHPLEEERINATQAMINAQPAASLRGLTKDTPNFQAFKRRLLSLPAPPPVTKKEQ
jgi:predicted Zn-dependent protease